MKGIYIFTHIVSGMQYIGQSRQVFARIRQQISGFNASGLLYAMIVKDGISAFRIEIEPYPDVTQDELDILERQRIKECKSLSPNGFNILNGKSVSSLCKHQIKRLSSEQWKLAFKRHGCNAEIISKAYGVAISTVNQHIMRRLKAERKQSLFQQQKTENREIALHLLSKGWTRRKIATHLGYKSASSVTNLLSE